VLAALPGCLSGTRNPPSQPPLWQVTAWARWADRLTEEQLGRMEASGGSNDPASGVLCCFALTSLRGGGPPSLRCRAVHLGVQAVRHSAEATGRITPGAGRSQSLVDDRTDDGQQDGPRFGNSPDLASDGLFVRVHVTETERPLVVNPDACPKGRLRGRVRGRRGLPS